MKTIYILVAREIEEGSEALVAFEEINEAIRVLYAIQAYHEPFYEKWAHQLTRSLDPAYAIARAAHPALVYSNCPSLTNIAEFDIQEVYFHPANPTATFPPATCGCDAYPVTWSHGNNNTWICTATLPGSIQVAGSGNATKDALLDLKANIERTKAELLKLGQGIPNALPLPTTNQQV